MQPSQRKHDRFCRNLFLYVLYIAVLWDLPSIFILLITGITGYLIDNEWIIYDVFIMSEHCEVFIDHDRM